MSLAPSAEELAQNLADLEMMEAQAEAPPAALSVSPSEQKEKKKKKKEAKVYPDTTGALPPLDCNRISVVNELNHLGARVDVAILQDGEIRIRVFQSENPQIGGFYDEVVNRGDVHRVRFSQYETVSCGRASLNKAMKLPVHKPEGIGIMQPETRLNNGLSSSLRKAEARGFVAPVRDNDKCAVDARMKGKAMEEEAKEIAAEASILATKSQTKPVEPTLPNARKRKVFHYRDCVRSEIVSVRLIGRLFNAEAEDYKNMMWLKDVKQMDPSSPRCGRWRTKVRVFSNFLRILLTYIFRKPRPTTRVVSIVESTDATTTQNGQVSRLTTIGLWRQLPSIYSWVSSLWCLSAMTRSSCPTTSSR